MQIETTKKIQLNSDHCLNLSTPDFKDKNIEAKFYKEITNYARFLMEKYKKISIERGRKYYPALIIDGSITIIVKGDEPCKKL